MTRNHRCLTSAVPALWVCALSSSLATLPGCDSGKRDTPCAQGNETCPCYGNHTCNGTLTCASDVCVDLTGGDASTTGGARNTGGAGSMNTLSEQGGSSGQTTSAGGSGIAGGTQNAGGTTTALTSTSTMGGDQSLGGAPTTGGLSGNAGGVVGSGGNSNAGGAPTTGGMTNAGGEQPIGGNASTGGATSVNTGSDVGGQNPIGGAPGTGGLTAAGGTTTGGQSSATGGAAPNTCGNGLLEAWEGCDPLPHDNNLGDGCTPLCKVEPDCAASGGCVTRCGDGFVIGDETCDDGNTVAGDGCSSTCQTEPDFDCSQPELPDSIVIPMVVRDFAAGGDFEKGGVFSSGLIHATQGLLKPVLNDKSKPELASTTGTYAGQSGKSSGISSAASFAQWYDDAAPDSGNAQRASLTTGLTLFKGSNGTYVNRWGINGEQWIRESYYGDHWCGSDSIAQKDADGKAIPCTNCPADDPTTPECDNPQPNDCQDLPGMIRCETHGTSYYGIYEEARFDGTPLFFPADALTPASPAATAQIPGYYNKNWPTDPSGISHNFSFTTETRFWFKYDASQTLTLSFLGDDDAWVFVNKRLAIDAGGIHAPVSGRLVVNTDGSATATVSGTETSSVSPIETNVNLGLEHGKLYEVAIFQAERQTTSSSYSLGFSGFNSAPSVCTHR